MAGAEDDEEDQQGGVDGVTFAEIEAAGVEEW